MLYSSWIWAPPTCNACAPACSAHAGFLTFNFHHIIKVSHIHLSLAHSHRTTAFCAFAGCKLTGDLQGGVLGSGGWTAGLAVILTGGGSWGEIQARWEVHAATTLPPLAVARILMRPFL